MFRFFLPRPLTYEYAAERLYVSVLIPHKNAEVVCNMHLLLQPHLIWKIANSRFSFFAKVEAVLGKNDRFFQ